MKMLNTYVVLVLALAVLAGCANRGSLEVKKAGESIGIYHEGKRIKQRHVVESEWGVPGEVAYVSCRPDQLTFDAFWGIPTCPDKIDQNATLAVDEGRAQIASYKDLVIPATISGLFQVAAFGTLGAVMPAPKLNVRQTGPEIRTSTLLLNAPVPGGVAR